MADNNVKPIAEQIGTTTISELRDINTSLSNSDQFIVLDIKEQGEVGPSEVAKKVSYRQIRENLTNDKSVIKGIDYCFEQNDLHEDTILHIQNDAYITDNLTDGFNVKTFNSLFEDWRTVNINKIKGEGELSLSVEKENNENILKLSVAKQSSPFKIGTETNGYLSISKLDIGRGLTFEEENSEGEDVIYSINLDANNVQGSIDAQIGNEIKQSIKRLIPEGNIEFIDGGNDSLVISSSFNNIEVHNDQLTQLFENGFIKASLLPEGSGNEGSSSYYPVGTETGRDGDIININLPGYTKQEGLIIAIRFNNAVNNNSPRLNINGTGNHYIICQGETFNNNNIIPANSIGLFVFDNNDNNYNLLSVNNIINVNNDTNNLITNIITNNNSYPIINSNILDDNNKIKNEILPTNVVTTNNNNYITINDIPTIQGDSSIRVNNENNIISIGLNLPSSENASNLYLNGTGQWSAININNSILFNYINDMFLPVGMYYYTSDPNFHPGDKGQGAGGEHWWSQNQLAAYENLRWQLDENKSDTSANPPIYCWHKMGTLRAG